MNGVCVTIDRVTLTPFPPVARARQGPSMLSIVDSSIKLCDGLSRREILRAAGAGLIGLPLLDDRLLAASSPPPKQTKAGIVVFLMGGPPQHSPGDRERDAAPEVRGASSPTA